MIFLFPKTILLRCNAINHAEPKGVSPIKEVLHKGSF